MTGYSGLPSVPVQDGAITWSQGAIVDRSTSASAPRTRCSSACVAACSTPRRQLRENGTAPPGVDAPEVYRQRSGWIVVPEEQDYWEASRPLREAFQKVEVPTATS